MERAMMTKEHRLQRRVEQLVRDLWGVICVKINVQTCNVQNAFERASMPASLIIMGVICVKINVQTCNVQNASEHAIVTASLDHNVIFHHNSHASLYLSMIIN